MTERPITKSDQRGGIYLLIAALAAAALVFTIFSSANRADSIADGEAKHYAGAYAQAANDEASSACDDLVVPYKTRCIDRAQRSARKHQREEYQLAAERKAANWNEAMGQAAIIGMFLSVLGLITIFLTYTHQQEALVSAREDAEKARRAARISSRAAVMQIKISQETAYRQLRAYISIEDAEIENVHNGIAEGRVFIRNAGQTPARIELWLNECVRNWPRLTMPDDAPAPVRFDFHGPFVNANGRAQIDWFFPLAIQAPETLDLAIQQHQHHVFLLYGRVEFVDFQRHRRIIHFCYRNHGRVMEGQPCELIPTPFGNGYEDRGIEEA